MKKKSWSLILTQSNVKSGKEIIQKDTKPKIANKRLRIKIEIRNKLKDKIEKKNHLNKRKKNKKNENYIEKNYYRFGLKDEIENK